MQKRRPVRPRTAVLLCAGTELVEGAVLNTHFRLLGSALKSLGISVLKGVQVPDEASLFDGELRRGVQQAGLVIVTGGLGPTSDDLTREIVAGVAGVPLEFRDELWAELVARYTAGGARSRPLPEANRRQACVPAGFEVLANARGTAPGFFGRVGGSLVAALPGPPRELEPMFFEQVVPLLAPADGGGPAQGHELVATVLLTPESFLEDTLRRLHRPEPTGPGAVGVGVLWGTRLAEDRIVLTLRGGSADSRERLLGDLRGELGELLLRPGDQGPAERLLEVLAARGLRVSFAESCTGGLAAKLLTDHPGSSRVLWGSVVAYDNEAKTRLLGVKAAVLERFGAVSRQTAEAMTRGLLAVSQADLGIAVTGIAGPGGGSPERPVGTVWISGGTASGEGVCVRLRLPGSRDMIRRKAAVAAFLVAECLATGKEISALKRLPGS